MEDLPGQGFLPGNKDLAIFFKEQGVLRRESGRHIRF